MNVAAVCYLLVTSINYTNLFSLKLFFYYQRKSLFNLKYNTLLVICPKKKNHFIDPYIL